MLNTAHARLPVPARGTCDEEYGALEARLYDAEQALRRSEETLRVVLTAVRLGLWERDLRTGEFSASAVLKADLGLSADAPLTFEQLQAMRHPDDAVRVALAMRRAIARKTDYHVEFRVVRPDRSIRIFLVRGHAVFEDGKAVRMIGVALDVTERKLAEERQHLLMRELHHRVKNTLATVQALIGSTARSASSVDDFYEGFVSRIVSLARTHDLLTDDDWQKASLEELLRIELGPYQDGDKDRITIEGPPVGFPSEVAVPIGMVIHELTTNAARHGALSSFAGRVEARWTLEENDEGPMLRFTWMESGGPEVAMPKRQGFGSRLLQRVLTTQLHAATHMEFAAAGIRVTIVMPLPSEAVPLNSL